jgi:hypothetical protein
MHTVICRRLMTACALTVALAAGCQSTSAPTTCSHCAPGSTNATCASCGKTGGCTVTYPAITTAPGQPSPRVAAAAPVTAAPATDPQAVQRPVTVVETPKQYVSHVDVAVIPPVAPSPAPVYHPDIVANQSDKPAFPRGAPTVNRRSFADITAHSSFGHSADYTWISGETMLFNKEWRLRYASVDELDRYGGSLRLAGEHELKDLKDGCHYKLQGRLSPDDGRGPIFQVTSVEALK